MMVLFFMLLIIVLVCVIKYVGYVNSTYYKITKKPVLAMRTDVGSYGEYCIFKLLKSYESQGAKFLFNVYLPKGENETTEIDVLMICSQGIYVFESKNYSGWIFGNEKYKMWTQTLPQGKGRPSKKEKFLNPIMQNKLHIRCLNEYLKKEYPVYSVIAFSQRCELKKIELVSDNAAVVKRNDILKVLAKNSKYVGQLDEKTISEIYDKLYPLTQVSEEVKKQHIENIKKETENENFGN